MKKLLLFTFTPLLILAVFSLIFGAPIRLPAFHVSKEYKNHGQVAVAECLPGILRSFSFKCYFRLKMLTSNNAVFEIQFKDFAISWKVHVRLLKCLVFHILNLSINFLIKGSWVF